MRLDEIKEKLELLYEEKVKEIVIRARARWHAYGERSTTIKYFLNLEKRIHVKKHIRKLLTSGSITTTRIGYSPNKNDFIKTYTKLRTL